MLTFPSLKSGAVLQYPARKSSHYSTQVLAFLDGSEQRYRLANGPLQRWIIQLELLDEAELAALEVFLSDTQGSFAEFSFVDPKEGKTYPKCYLESDTLEGLRAGASRGKTTLTIVESRTS